MMKGALKMSEPTYIDAVAGEALGKRVAVVCDERDTLVYAATPGRDGITGVRGITMHTANEGGSIRFLVQGEVHTLDPGECEETGPVLF